MSPMRPVQQDMRQGKRQRWQFRDFNQRQFWTAYDNGFRSGDSFKQYRAGYGQSFPVSHLTEAAQLLRSRQARSAEEETNEEEEDPKVSQQLGDVFRFQPWNLQPQMMNNQHQMLNNQPQPFNNQMMNNQQWFRYNQPWYFNNYSPNLWTP